MIVSISGAIGSGKDSVGNVLRTHGFQKISFGESLKDGVAKIFNMDREMLEGATPEAREAREQVDRYWSQWVETDQDVTPRFVLEHVATELFRSWCPPIWIKSCLQRAQKLIDAGVNLYTTDTRFINEFVELQKYDVLFLGVHRRQPEWVPQFYRIVEALGIEPGDDWSHPEQQKYLIAIQEALVQSGLRIHASRWQHLLWHKYDHIIANTGSLDSLTIKVEKIWLDHNQK